MRVLDPHELQLVSGGDTDDYNSTACATSVAAVSMYSGATYGVTAGSAAGVFSMSAIEVCEVITTSVGESIGSSIAGAIESFDLFMNELQYTFDSLEYAAYRYSAGI